MHRVKTGVKGFDNLIQGGFPKNSTIVIDGQPGTGKTIFALQFLFKGYTMFKENGLYVSFEQMENELIDQAKEFGWSMKSRVSFYCLPAEEIKENILDTIVDIVKKHKIKRLVIDSLPALYINAPIYKSSDNLSLAHILQDSTILTPAVIGQNLTERFIYSFINRLKKINCTTLLITEDHMESDPGNQSREGVSAYLCDGIVSLKLEPTGGEEPRSIMITKMRMTKINPNLYPFSFTKKGIEVKTD